MKLSCSSWSFHRTFEQGKINQLEWIEKCAKDLMLDGIELLDEHFRSTEKAYLCDLNKGADYKQDYDKIFEIFNRAHYRGFISVEYEGKEDELLAVPRGVKFLKKYI